MPRTYPVGYRISIDVTRTAAGPSARLSWIASTADMPQEIGGLISYEALGDLEALLFALLDEITADPF